MFIWKLSCLSLKFIQAIINGELAISTSYSSGFLMSHEWQRGASVFYRCSRVTAQSHIRGNRFTGTAVLSLLPNSPREQTPSTSAITTGQNFIYSSCFKKTPTYCMYQCVSSPLRKCFLNYSLFSALFLATTPQVQSTAPCNAQADTEA